MSVTTTTHTEPTGSGQYPEAVELHDRTTPLAVGPKSVQVPGPVDEPPEEPPGIDRPTALKLVAVGFSFFVSGINDGSIGALIPYFIRDYNLSTAVVSVVYGANFFGWFLAALTNTHLTKIFRLGGLLAFGAVFQLLAHALRSWKPPFPFFAITFCLVCLGQAYQDTGGNTYVASVKGAHRWLAFIHAMYMAGSLVAPFVATAIASAGDPSKWYLYYTFPAGFGVVNLALTCFAFRDTINFRLNLNRTRLRADTPEQQSHDDTPEEPASGSSSLGLMRAALSNKSVWLISLFFFFYLGAAMTATGWVVEYLVEVRGGDLSQMGYVPAGFNGGCLLGRILLAEPTHRYGERRMIFVFAVLCIAFQLAFWLVPNIIAASVAVSLIGFFSGPFFATGISVGSKLFPHNIKPTALAFVFVFAQSGGSFFPIITGVMASRINVGVLQPVLVALFVGTAVSWLLVPRLKKSENAALHQE